jgi:hypothetical protein
LFPGAFFRLALVFEHLWGAGASHYGGRGGRHYGVYEVEDCGAAEDGI